MEDGTELVSILLNAYVLVCPLTFSALLCEFLNHYFESPDAIASLPSFSIKANNAEQTLLMYQNPQHPKSNIPEATSQLSAK